MELEEIYRQIDLFKDSEHPINEILDQLKENIYEVKNDDLFLTAINKKMEDYLFVKKAMKAKMIESLIEAIIGLMNEKNDEYKLRDKIKKILDYHDLFDFAQNGNELLEHIKLTVIPPKES